MNLKIKAFVAASFLALAGSGAYAANSDAAADNHAFAISYSDLDLSTEAGNQTLYKRIREAAEKACPGASATGSRIATPDRKCVDSAVAQAVKGIHSPMLAQVHASYAHHTAGG